MRRLSCVLFSLFVAFKFLPKDLINYVVSAYFALLVRCRPAARLPFPRAACRSGASCAGRWRRRHAQGPATLVAARTTRLA